MAHSHWISWIALLACACCAGAHSVDEMSRHSLEPRAEPITLPSEVLDRYTGVYVIQRRPDHATYLTIQRYGERLSLEISGVPGPLALRVRDRNVFAGPHEIELTFLGADSAPATRLRYRQGSRERMAARADMSLEF